MALVDVEEEEEEESREDSRDSKDESSPEVEAKELVPVCSSVKISMMVICDTSGITGYDRRT